jgi:hypothetical protein
MARRWLIGWVLVSAAWCVAKEPAPAKEQPAEATPALAEVRAAVETAWAKYRSLRIQVHSLVDTPNAIRTVELKGTIEILRREDGTEWIRSDTTTIDTMGKGENALVTRLNKLEILNDDSAHQVQNLKNDVVVYKIDPIRIQRVAGGMLIEQLSRFNALTVLPNAKIGEKSMYLLEGKPNPPVPNVEKVRVWIDTATGVMAKFAMYATDGAEMQVLNLFDAKFDVTLDPQLFVFKMPTSAKLVDLTTKQKSKPKPATSSNDTPGGAGPGAKPADDANSTGVGTQAPSKKNGGAS